MHPGAWLVWTLCGGLVAISTTNPFYLVPLLGCAWIVHTLKARPGPGARSFKVFALFGLAAIVTRTALVVLGPVSTGSVAAAALEGLRLAVLLAIYGAFNSVADPFRVLRLAPRRFYEPALAAALALSIAPRTVEAVARVREAQRLRGIDPGRLRALPALAVPVLETGMEEAVTLAESMDARGHGRGRRTHLRPERFSPWAWVTVVASLGGLAAFLAASGEANLSPSTVPLTWPQAHVTLVAAALAFAVPAFTPRERP